MSLSPRTETVLENARGYLGVEDELARPDLEEVLFVSADVLPGAMQTPAYTGVIVRELESAGLLVRPDRGVTEIDKRQPRNRAVLEDPNVHCRFLTSAVTLGVVVGSREITADAIRNGLTIVEHSLDGTLPNVEVAFYTPDYTTYDPYLFCMETNTQTLSGENDLRVWVADSGVLAPRDSNAHHAFPRAAAILLDRETTVSGQAAYDLMDEALVRMS